MAVTAGAGALVGVSGAVGVLATTHLAEPTTTWTALGAIATATAAVVAIWTLIALKQDSADRTRPVIVAELRAAVLTRNCELIIRNAGQSVARDVSVEFDPPLPVLEGKEAMDKVTPYLQRRYSRTIPSFAPGQVMDNIYQEAADSTEPVPDNFTVTIRYKDMHSRNFTDSYVLSVDTLRDQTGAYPSNTDDKGIQRRLVNAIEAIARGVGRH